MERTMIEGLGDRIGETVRISGWVDVRRDQGKMVFFDFRDRSGRVQGVCLPGSSALETAKEVGKEYVVRVEGVVHKRPEKNVQEGKQNGDIELEVKSIDILSRAAGMPFDTDADLNLDTLLDYRPLTLRRPRERAIFTLQAALVQAYRNSLIRQGFMEFQAPALVGSDAEGGAEVFRVDYFNEQTANLATSPQLYKQIMTGVYERVFTIARVFRAEKSATTRHISELTQMDFEMAFIEDEQEVMFVLEEVMRDVVRDVQSKYADLFALVGTDLPLVPEAPFPILTLREAQEILGVSTDDPDLEPAHERGICEWAQREKGSDFVFITRFPTHKRSFYTYEHAAEAPHSRGFDLLFRGLEINSGAQRIHDYDVLVKRIEERGMDPKNFAFYLQAFKYGMPPHGGCSTGLERLTMKMLDLDNVKEATLFPRDMNRIDVLLHGTDSGNIKE
ncbi:MAG TPA: aspartate--tRNA(Asn) ligase [Candidatus Paceibacterota bacterium]|nr:aspartate--tRNA(Asn) ligase [Candidatus Paceibacterota bacterium]